MISLFSDGNTAHNLEASIEAFEKWWGEAIDEKLDFEESNQAFDAIFNLVRDYSEFHYKRGVKQGVRLMHEALGESVSMRDIESVYRKEGAYVRKNKAVV